MATTDNRSSKVCSAYSYSAAAARPARSILGPNGLFSKKETTNGIVRWTQVDGVTLHDGTPRSDALQFTIIWSVMHAKSAVILSEVE